MSEFLERGHVSGDVFIRDTDGGEYTRESKTVTNGGSDDWTLPAGYPMDDNVPIQDGGEAGVDGLLWEEAKIPAGESRKVAVVVRGSIVVNRDALPTEDYTGDAFNVGTIATALASLGFVVRREPQTQAEQET